MHMKSKYGKIIGLAFIPYITSKPKKDENGNFIIQKDSKGKPMKRKFRNEKGEVVEEPLLEREKILSKDGDTLFIVPKHTGLYAVINREVEFVRCNPKYHSDLVGDVYIKDVNIVPYGDFFYPAKQWQEDIVQIMTENQAEAVAMTHSNWLDLASLYTHLSIGGDPTFQKIMLAQSERLSTPNPTA